MQRGRNKNERTRRYNDNNPRQSTSGGLPYNRRRSTSNSDVRRNHAENGNTRKKCYNQNQSNSHENLNVRNQNQSEFKNAKLLGFKFLESLVEQDPQDIFLTLCNEKSGFKKLLNSTEITSDRICLVVTLIAKLCKFSFNTKNDFITDLFTSNFKDKLTAFISSIVTQTNHDKRQNSYFWRDTDMFWLSIIQISETVCNLIPSHSKEVHSILNNLDILFPIFEQRHKMHISDSIKESVKKLIDLAERKIRCAEVRLSFKKGGSIDDYDLEPPDDFRAIQIMPNVEELLGQSRVFLRSNIVDRAYRDVDHYLDVQFRLLREDFVAPLRQGITAYRKNLTLSKNSPKEKVDNIKFYKNVKILNEVTINELVCYKIKLNFDKSKMKSMKLSKRFMFGSLVCLTKNNFESLLFGRVAEKNINDFKNGVIVLSFDEQIVVDFSADYLLLESTVYFKPYYHVLNTLQTMSPFKFPMERYIIKLENNVVRPKYLSDQVMIECPSGLNQSQVRAFKAALNEELCIIQGPPGTGKTYIGLKIVQALLSVSKLWFDEGPILIVCYTNHALDQFLEHLLKYTHSILRVGGQSKSERLQQYNLVNRKRKFKKIDEVSSERRHINKLMKEISEYTSTLNQIQSNNCVLKFDCFETVITDYHSTWFKHASDNDVIKWLMAGKYTYQEEDNYNDGGELNSTVDEYGIEGVDDFEEEDFDNPNDILLDDIFRKADSTPKLKVLMSISDFQSKVKSIQHKINMAMESDDFDLLDKLEADLFEVQADCTYLEKQLRTYDSTKNYAKRYNLSMPDLMSATDRWEFYFYLKNQLTLKLRQDLSNIREVFNRHYRMYSDLRDIENAHVMKEHKIIGMTTTAAARLRSALNEVASPIVIVEEAAEVLESHIITALSENCQHLILIGDHLQLKPSTADYKIERNYNLGISLFERLVRNNVRCYTLNVQHRMRPEISSLIKPSIYENLIDHNTTLDRERILGMNKCLYFIHHSEKETSNDTSKSNEHEVIMFIELAKRLILNGYKGSQITILAAYLNQMFLFKEYIKKHENKKLLEGIPVCVLDNYQGEESDIILLSLVRNNAEGVAGFLRIQNRVCVALSRARNGLYIMGNMNLLLSCHSENNIWSSVYKTLKDQDAISEYFPLKCEIHPSETISVKTVEDFQAISGGGCLRICATKLSCGHPCQKLCHLEDMEHILSKCHFPCEQVLCSNPKHICKKKCHEKCGLCTYEVDYILSPCMHPATLPCHMNPEEYNCIFPIPSTLPCGHEADRPCSVDEYTFSCPVDCKKRLECGHTCKRKCHDRDDPDHLQHVCNQRCARPKRGCKTLNDENEAVHRCQKLCYQDCEECTHEVKRLRSCGHKNTIMCKDNVENVPCIKPCKKILPCEHKCTNKCSEVCSTCVKKVKKAIPGCNHIIEVVCSLIPERSMCKSKTCPRILPCGHLCKEQCKNQCTQLCREPVKCNIELPCGHIINSIMCYLQNERSTEVLLQHCPHPCDSILKCNHRCSGTCGQCVQSRFHLKCTQKCGATLVCSHECTIPCREACRPCSKPCQVKCAHSTCPLKCGQPCKSCTEVCKRECEHIKCNKNCGQICDVGPCTEKCKKHLKCGHLCVGFCNDPCPDLCRKCDKEELTQIFLGNEDNPDAIYVMLNDCKHIFESSDLEKWMKMDADQIKFKVCPRCSTSIKTTERYSDYIKRSMQDIAAAKVISYGTNNDNEKLRRELLDEIFRLEIKIPSEVRLFLNNFDNMKRRLNPLRGFRKQHINKLELYAIKSKIQILTNIWNTLKDTRLPYTNRITDQCNLICKVLLRSEDQITDQEIEDIKYETMRLDRIVQLNKLQLSLPPSHETGKLLEQHICGLLFQPSRYNLNLDSKISAYIKNLSNEINVIITDAERIEIVKAIGLAKGHWYKCPNGHPYAIGECGGANQIARCLCGAQIGGMDHHLLRSNAHAGEMDGSERHAWPGGLY
ncbi:NFX1-type zinc finger-containing protein 1-like isoform X2 [Rhynchophorus ferrugineus]|uniref:NFX1-type zinc finger-containing protein 1-like isoform X2 n=1 Tax=Rhynchophorus ferrugineus TaxID=354439 RepID=UPI003FCD12D0